MENAREPLTVEEIIRVQQPRYFVELKPEYIIIEDGDDPDDAYSIALTIGDRATVSTFDRNHNKTGSFHGRIS